MNLTFQNRIAINFLVAMAIVMAAIFGFIFFTVHQTVYHQIDKGLEFEALEHLEQLQVIGDSIKFIDESEWEESEHTQIQVNPMFMQITDKNGVAITKSPNLKSNFLVFSANRSKENFNTTLNGVDIRQTQTPIKFEGEIKGYILTAMSLDSTLNVLSNLRNVLFISFLVMLVGIYYTSNFVAGRSVVPVKKMVASIKSIAKNNFDERVGLPGTKDELHALAVNTNELLQRIEDTIKRERQFSSDASHELRTPLASIKGTLEVLIRRPRDEEEYVSKIKSSLKEIDRIEGTLEQLFLLSRLDSNYEFDEGIKESLQEIVNDVLIRYSKSITEKKMIVNLTSNLELNDLVPKYYSSLMIETIISNAIKYGDQETEINIEISRPSESVKCTITNYGIVIDPKDFKKIFHRFYRSGALNHKHISGYGLGLSIAKKSAQAIGAEINVCSSLEKGTSFTILF